MISMLEKNYIQALKGPGALNDKDFEHLGVAIDPFLKSRRAEWRGGDSDLMPGRRGPKHRLWLQSSEQ